jgi:predicted nucleic acid-binding protein
VIVAALVDGGPVGGWAERIVAGGTVYVPELALVEASNVLRRLERSRQISSAEANAAYEDLTDLHVELCSFESVAERVWELRHSMTSYDAWYVAVAEALQLPLATLDRRLARTKNLRCAFVSPGTR